MIGAARCGRIGPSPGPMAAVMFLAAPLLTLLVQAAGNRWTGSSILPQEFGTRGLRETFSDPLIGPAIMNSTLVAVATVVDRRHRCVARRRAPWRETIGKVCNSCAAADPRAVIGHR